MKEGGEHIGEPNKQKYMKPCDASPQTHSVTWY